jgi:hypothetical protein
MGPAWPPVNDGRQVGNTMPDDLHQIKRATDDIRKLVASLPPKERDAALRALSTIERHADDLDTDRRREKRRARGEA